VYTCWKASFHFRQYRQDLDSFTFIKVLVLTLIFSISSSYFSISPQFNVCFRKLMKQLLQLCVVKIENQKVVLSWCRVGACCLPTWRQLLRSSQVPFDPQGQGRQWVRHQGTKQRSGVILVIEIILVIVTVSFCLIITVII